MGGAASRDNNESDVANKIEFASQVPIRGTTNDKMATRVSSTTKNHAIEMMDLLEALPPSPARDALFQHEQVFEWRRHADAALKKYDHKVTTHEREKGSTIDPVTGEVIKFKKRGVRCEHCSCVSQEIKRHYKTAKCIKAQLLNEEERLRTRATFNQVVMKQLLDSAGTSQFYYIGKEDTHRAPKKRRLKLKK